VFYLWVLKCSNGSTLYTPCSSSSRVQRRVFHTAGARYVNPARYRVESARTRMKQRSGTQPRTQIIDTTVALTGIQYVYRLSDGRVPVRRMEKARQRRGGRLDAARRAGDPGTRVRLHLPPSSTSNRVPPTSSSFFTSIAEDADYLLALRLAPHQALSLPRSTSIFRGIIDYARAPRRLRPPAYSLRTLARASHGLSRRAPAARPWLLPRPISPLTRPPRCAYTPSSRQTSSRPRSPPPASLGAAGSSGRIRSPPASPQSCTAKLPPKEPDHARGARGSA
jgi:hypothetical protein